ncbi:iron-sulfur cluster biosynthesis family protein [Paenibacillus protaetiae]|uniref:Iron-sulfur cluster biosynthesis family protein n=1 Tax=Paenibacillus protaetiae TaxID=2509456 RepID=A0A4P6F6N1_9BACL|nr:iron-sulfur cluster biosynthesis family protein [Paenibacillus protaetiae]QAY66068.1 iron-sulfur cluster biosynthesis family protein [Paenibacillus protaetiae]
MRIQFTPSAVNKLKPYLDGSGLQLKFLHDTEGCGCVVSGVPALELIREHGADDRLAHGEPFDFWYEPRHEIYYEPVMTIDFNPAKGIFSLKSDSQIYSVNVKLAHPPAETA